MCDRRLSKDLYYIGIAHAVAARGTCLRRNYGAVVVANDQIVSTGYNGAPRGLPNCISMGASCPRNAAGVPQGQQYDNCRSVHAELNAIIHGGRREVLGGTLYLVGESVTGEALSQDPEPCEHCWQAVVNAGIERVVAERRDGTLRSTVVGDWVKAQAGAALPGAT
jgi:dCMP deaminase